MGYKTVQSNPWMHNEIHSVGLGGLHSVLYSQDGHHSEGLLGINKNHNKFVTVRPVLFQAVSDTKKSQKCLV